MLLWVFQTDQVSIILAENKLRHKFADIVKPLGPCFLFSALEKLRHLSHNRYD